MSESIGTYILTLNIDFYIGTYILTLSNDFYIGTYILTFNIDFYIGTYILTFNIYFKSFLQNSQCGEASQIGLLGSWWPSEKYHIMIITV